MRKTAHIPPAWWLTEHRRLLAKRGPAHLAAWVAICTGPSSHVSGVGYLPTAEIANLSGISADRAAKILCDLENDGLLVLDRANSLGWLVGVIENQLGSARWWINPKWLAATISYFESLPVSTAIDGFLAHYGLSDRIGYRYPIGRVFAKGNRVSGIGVPSCSSLPSLSSKPAPPSANFPPQDENGLDLPGGDA